MSSHPPLDAPVAYVHDGNQQHGPMPIRQILDTVSSGQASPDVNVWWEGAEGWAPLSSHPELAAQLSQGPPPTADAPAPPMPAPAAAPPPSQRSEEEINELEALFSQQIHRSWEHFKRIDFHGRLDEVLLGAMITSTLDSGQVLIDLTSGTALVTSTSTGGSSSHYLRFEDPTTHARTTIAMQHLTAAPAAAEVLGHHARMEIGWGQRVSSPSDVINAIKQEVKGALIQTVEPGTVTIDGDLSSGYAYTQIDLIWALEDFVAKDYSVDHERLRSYIDAVVHSLQKYWYGRFEPAS